MSAELHEALPPRLEIYAQRAGEIVGERAAAARFGDLHVVSEQLDADIAEPKSSGEDELPSSVEWAQSVRERLDTMAEEAEAANQTRGTLRETEAPKWQKAREAEEASRAVNKMSWASIEASRAELDTDVDDTQESRRLNKSWAKLADDRIANQPAPVAAEAKKPLLDRALARLDNKGEEWRDKRVAKEAAKARRVQQLDEVVPSDTTNTAKKKPLIDRALDGATDYIDQMPINQQKNKDTKEANQAAAAKLKLNRKLARDGMRRNDDDAYKLTARLENPKLTDDERAELRADYLELKAQAKESREWLSSNRRGLIGRLAVRRSTGANNIETQTKESEPEVDGAIAVPNERVKAGFGRAKIALRNPFAWSGARISNTGNTLNNYFGDEEKGGRRKIILGTAIGVLAAGGVYAAIKVGHHSSGPGNKEHVKDTVTPPKPDVTHITPDTVGVTPGDVAEVPSPQHVLLNSTDASLPWKHMSGEVGTEEATPRILQLIKRGQEHGWKFSGGGHGAIDRVTTPDGTVLSDNRRINAVLDYLNRLQ